MLSAKMKVRVFARIRGHFSIMRPYTSHKPTPSVNREYMPKEIPERSLVRQDRIACGKKAIVVKKAAQYPIISIW
jgi:hypothetical protein